MGAIDNSVPIYYHSELPAIKILVGGEEKLVLIDTGAASLVLSLKNKILQNDGIDTKEIQRFKNIQPKDQQIIFKPVNEPWRLFVMQFEEPKVDIIIGMDTLKGKRLFLNYIDKKYFIG